MRGWCVLLLWVFDDIHGRYVLLLVFFLQTLHSRLWLHGAVLWQLRRKSLPLTFIRIPHSVGIVQPLQRVRRDLAQARILLIGAGGIGEQSAKAFRSRGAHAITVSSRTAARAMALASTLDASAIPFEKVQSHLSDFDIVACATAAPGAILTAETIAKAMKSRPTAPLFLIDLALPRDIDPAAAKLENVYLYNLDDLAKISDENRSARLSEVEKAQSIIRERTDRLWSRVRGQVPGADSA